MNNPDNNQSPNLDDVVDAKLRDSTQPGCIVSFDPEEADMAGAFPDDAVDEDDVDAAMEDGE